MDFNLKRPKKPETISQVLLMFGLATSKVASPKGLKKIFDDKNLYLYKKEITTIVEEQSKDFNGKEFVNFLNELGAIAPGEPRINIGGGSSRLTMSRAKQVAPGKEEMYLKLANILSNTRVEINAIMPEHRWDFALKFIKKDVVVEDVVVEEAPADSPAVEAQPS